MANTLFGRAQPLWTRLFPKQSEPRGLRAAFPLATVQSYTFTFQLTEIGLDFINGIFVDNSQNTAGFTLTNPVTGQIIYVPANSQAHLSLITQKSTDNISFIGASTGGVDVPCIFRNTEPVSDGIYSTVAQGQIIGAVTVQGSVTALPYQSNGVDAASETIAAGGVSQSLFAANVARKGMVIANPASGPSQGLGQVQPESLFINFGGAASGGGIAGNIEIAPGGYFQLISGIIDTRSVFIVGATTGHVFSATQYQ